MRILAILMLLTTLAGAQNLSTLNTSLTTITYLTTFTTPDGLTTGLKLPCTGFASECNANSNASLHNDSPPRIWHENEINPTLIAPNDVEIKRVTDINWGAGHWKSSIEGNGFGNGFDVSSDRFVIGNPGGNCTPVIADQNPANWPTDQPHAYSGGSTLACGGTATFSFVTDHLLYTLAPLFSGNQGIYSWNLSSTSTIGSSTLVQDLTSGANCLAGGTQNQGNNSELSVSQDDNTFSTAWGVSSGNRTIVIVWNRTKGCFTWHTDTGALACDSGWGSWCNGTTMSYPAGATTFYIHEVYLSQDGTGILIGAATGDCTGVGCWGGSGSNGGRWKVNFGTATATLVNFAQGQSHTLEGYSVFVGNAWISILNQFFMYQDSNPSALGCVLNNGTSAPTVIDSHFSWNNNNSGNTAPLFNSSYVSALPATSVTQPYEGEIDAVDPVHYNAGCSGPYGNVWRIAHGRSDGVNYTTTGDGDFNGLYNIGVVSQKVVNGYIYFEYSSNMLGGGNGCLDSTYGCANSTTNGPIGQVFLVRIPASSNLNYYFPAR